MIELQQPYLSVMQDLRCSYGGNQMLSPNKTMRQCGCGVVAACDLLLYLKRRQGDSTDPLCRWPVDLKLYNERLLALQKRYFPLIPHHGINGILLVFGLNRLLRDEGLPFRALWMFSGARLWERVEEQLRRDIPVILSVGPHFPLIWRKDGLSFYVRRRDGSMNRAAAVCGHYVTATGLDDEWVRIASWGVQYYINRREYETFVRQHSSYLFSNIITLR